LFKELPSVGYNTAIIYREVCEALSRKPGRSLHEIATDLKLERHTVTRAVKRLAGVSFRELQTQYIRRAIQELDLRREPLLRKQIADELGLPSTRSLLGWLRRIGVRSRNAPTAPKLPRLRQTNRRQQK
jgi:hypothetical protein